MHRSSSRGARRHASVVRIAVAAVALFAASLTVISLAGGTSARADSTKIANDNGDTGWYSDEPGLAPSNVTQSGFGEVFDTTVTGDVFAQPLVSDGTLLVVTEENNADGLDPATGAVQWEHSYDPAWNPEAQINCGDLKPYMGITGTPVIDPATDTAYFITDTADGTNGAAIYYMQAVNVATGFAPAGWPTKGVQIQGSADDDPNQVFNPQYEAQRPGLVLIDGVVYAGFGSHCDYLPWTGWLVGVSTSTASVTTMWATESGTSADHDNDGQGGIWQSGDAPVVDANGDIYVTTGNGLIPTAPEAGTANPEPVNYGEAVVELGTSGGKLHVVDWFIPQDAASLNSADGDLGSGGPVALPASMGTAEEPDVMLAVGKEGILYDLNMDALGGYEQGPGGSDAIPAESAPFGGVWSRPAVWPGDGGYVYVPTSGTTTLLNTSGGVLNVFQREVNGSGDVYFQLVGSTASSGSPFGFGSGAPVVTSNGTTSGSALVWIVQASNTNTNGTGSELEAFNPIPQNPGASGSLQEVWHSSTFTSSTFASPGVNNGYVYVGTSDQAVLGFGSLASSSPALTGSNVDFPSTVVSQTATDTATFTATAATTVTSAVVAGTGFALDNPPSFPVSLSQGQQLNVPLTWTPQAVATANGTLTVGYTGGTTTVDLEGQGLAANATISISPSTANFGVQPSDGPPVSQLITVTNETNASINVTGFESPSPPFSVPDAPSSSPLGAGRSLTFHVDFSPPGTSGDFEHDFNDVATIDTSVGKFGIPIYGVAAPPAQLNVSSATLFFGNVNVNSTETMNFTVGDQGAIGLDITASTPPDAGGFSALSTLVAPSTIAANGSEEETVQFKPAAAGPASATWVIVSSAGTETVTMEGTGISSGGGGGGSPPGVTTTTTATTTTVPVELPTMHLADASTAVTGADARFEFSCFVATCTGTTELTIVETEHYRVKGHLRTRSVRVDLGSAKYHIAAWAKGRVLVRLSSGARTMLARSSHHRLVVTLRLTLKGGPTKNFRVVLT